MDSRSDSEGSALGSRANSRVATKSSHAHCTKVHRFRKSVKAPRQIPQCTRGCRSLARVLAAITALTFSTACEPDPREVDGAIARAVAAASKRDSEGLFQALDQRARFALSSTVKARQLAVGVIQAGYPQAARAEALASLGEAGEVEGAVALFARRCPDTCMDELAQLLAPPKRVEHHGSVADVETIRGGKLQLYRDPEGNYGLIWNTPALQRENTRAFAELDLIKKNADMYAKQRSLE
jgi:hypothetical protein